MTNNNYNKKTYTLLLFIIKDGKQIINHNLLHRHLIYYYMIKFIRYLDHCALSITATVNLFIEYIVNILCFQINDHRILSNVERFQETETPAMEEFTDTEKTSHPVFHRTPVAGHHGVHNGPVQIMGGPHRTQRCHQIRAVSHFGAAIDFRLQTRVRPVIYLNILKF